MDNIVNLTITVVAFNNYDLVEEAIKSIENKTDAKIKKKIFVVDNSDSEYKKNRSFHILWKDVILIDSGGNIGFSKANNLVLKNLNSEYHAIVNPDIFLFEDTFSKIINFLNENLDVGMVIPKIIDKNGNLQSDYRRELTIFDMFVHSFGERVFKKRYKYHTMQDKNFNSVFQVPFGQGSFLVIRTKIFNILNGFDERFFLYMEDADLCKRVNDISKLVYYPYTFVEHKWEKKSHKNLKLFLIHLTSCYNFFKKWGLKLF